MLYGEKIVVVVVVEALRRIVAISRKNINTLASWTYK